jgi:hypothetical protein
MSRCGHTERDSPGTRTCRCHASARIWSANSSRLLPPCAQLGTSRHLCTWSDPMSGYANLDAWSKTPATQTIRLWWLKGCNDDSDKTISHRLLQVSRRFVANFVSILGWCFYVVDVSKNPAVFIFKAEYIQRPGTFSILPSHEAEGTSPLSLVAVCPIGY